MKWCGEVLLVLCVCASVRGGKWDGKIGEIGDRSGGNKKMPSQSKNLRQPPPSSFDSRPPSSNLRRSHNSKPPPHHPNRNHVSKPPPYSLSFKQPPAPEWDAQANQAHSLNPKPSTSGRQQLRASYNSGTSTPSHPPSGGQANIPMYYHHPLHGLYPKSGSFPEYDGYPPGSYLGYGAYPSGSLPQFPKYSQSYEARVYEYKKKKALNMPRVLPLPVVVPLGGSELGFGTLGGGFFWSTDNSLAKYEDENGRPRAIVFPDIELEGVEELPSDYPVPKWDFVWKEKEIPRILVASDTELEGVTELPSDYPINQWDSIWIEKVTTESKKRGDD